MMYNNKTFDGSKNSAAPKSLTALLLGIIICYQILSHIFLNTALSHEDNELHSDDSDAACAAVPGAGASSLCMEAQLFRGWKELPPESPEDLEKLLSISPSGTAEQQPRATTTVAPASASPSGGTASNLRASTTVASDPIAEAKPEALEGMLWDLAFQLGGGDQSHSPPQKHHKKPTPSMRGAAKARDHMKKQAAHKPKRPLAKSLTDLQQKLEAKMQSQARRHAEHRALRALSVAARETAEVPAAEDGMTPWAHNLDDLTHELQDHMKARRKARDEHVAARATVPSPAVMPAQAASENMAGEHVLLDEVQALGQQLCQDPERRNRPVCAQFMRSHSSSPTGHPGQGHSTHKDRDDNAMAHIKLLEKHLEELQKEREHETDEIEHESTEILRQLCADPARSSYPTCAHLLATRSVTSSAVGPTAATPTSSNTAISKGLRGESSHLRWTAMKDQEPSVMSPHVGVPELSLRRHELRGVHWEGKVPKVVCVTVLPQGQVTETLMKYFMDNYNLQRYEGENQLVIVYHNTDREAARISHLYADGTSVIAAAARGGGAFPSATAFRYGAWLAHGADLVARWDFEAWHHPNRLSMQVRSLALSGRPASLVARITSFDAEGKNTTIPGGTGLHGSMVGDAGWMQKHWMPLLEEESSVPLGLQAHRVVQVDMPELLAYHDTTASPA